jgi:hypothetical protein
MNVNDIEKAQPKKDTYAAAKTKDLMKTKDIEGTSSRPRVFNRPRDNFSSLFYNDVTRPTRQIERGTNPLMPVYIIRDENNTRCEIGPVDGSQPARMPSPAPEHKKIGLTTKDIPGAQSDTKGLGVFANAKRQNEPLSTSLKIQDIPGAQAGSLKKGP